MFRLTSTPVLTGLLAFVFALAFPVQKLGLRGVDSTWFAAGRAVVATLTLAPFLPAARRFTLRDHCLCSGLGFTNIAGFIGLQIAGLKLIGAGPAAAIIYLQPVLVLFIGRLVIGTPLTPQRIIGVTFGFAGVAIVVVHELAFGSPGGVVLLLLAALSWAVGTVLLKVAASRPLLPLLALQTLYGTLPLVVVALVFATTPPLTARLLLSLLYVGALSTAGGWFVLSILVRRGDVGSVSSTLFFVPLLSTILSAFILSEPIPLTLLVGAVCVGFGVRLVTSNRSIALEATP